MHQRLEVVRARKVREELQAKFPYAVECRPGNIDNLEQRQRRGKWLTAKFGPRGTRWDYFIRTTGGSTMCFVDHRDAVLFKLTWAGDV